MSDGISFQNVKEFYTSKENYVTNKQSKTTVSKSGVLKVLLIVLITFLVIEAVIYSLFMPCLTPVKVTYQGLHSFSPSQIAKMLDISPKTTWIQFDIANAATQLTSNAAIESVIIQKHFPDQVVINVVERQAVAFTLANIDGKTIPMQIDKNGVVFAINKGIPTNNIPLITGLNLNMIQEGMRIDSSLRALMDHISKIQKDNSFCFSMLSEMKIVSNSTGSYELELYPLESHVKVLVDRTLDESILKYMVIALEVISKIDKNVSIIDLRYGSFSYR